MEIEFRTLMARTFLPVAGDCFSPTTSFACLKRSAINFFCEKISLEQKPFSENRLLEMRTFVNLIIGKTSSSYPASVVKRFGCVPTNKFNKQS